MTSAHKAPSRRSSLLKVLLVFLIGGLVGANGVYYLMTRARPAAPAAPAAVTAPPVAVVPPPPASEAAAPRTPRTSPSPSSWPAPAPAPSGLIVPVAGVVASQLADTFTAARGTDRVHDAIDIMAPRGTPVFAVTGGTVEKLFDSKQGGLTLYQFEPSGRHAYYYAHLDRYAPGVVEGKALTQGELIGYVGYTGNANPDAPHLHFAVFVLGPQRRWWEGTAINPYPLLGGR